MYRGKLKYWKDQHPNLKEKLFTDDLFPPNEKSIIGNPEKNKENKIIIHPENQIDPSKIEWKRPSERG